MGDTFRQWKVNGDIGIMVVKGVEGLTGVKSWHAGTMVQGGSYFSKQTFHPFYPRPFPRTDRQRQLCKLPKV